MTEPIRRGRPRDPSIPEETRNCPEHGLTTFRRYKNGKDRHGKQQYAWFCLIDHNERNKAQSKRSRASSS